MKVDKQPEKLIRYLGMVGTCRADEASLTPPLAPGLIYLESGPPAPPARVRAGIVLRAAENAASARLQK